MTRGRASADGALFFVWPRGCTDAFGRR